MASEPKRLSRAVQFAAEFIDPISGERVSCGLGVRALDAQGRPTGRVPILNRSGRFIWRVYFVADGSEAPPPAEIEIEPGKLPYYADAFPLPQIPGDRLVRFHLRPSPAYAVPDGITALRGRLVETLPDAEPVPDALLRLAWTGPEGQQPQVLPQDARSDEHGEFVVSLRARPGFDANVAAGRPTAELHVFRFEDDETKHRVAGPLVLMEGRLQPRDDVFDWSDLTAVI
ncbi:hypothetical protein [Microvirga splendida]|uniref:Uncharacterized protein n=1 Tax=Microvirga splendida TaxID=2795727 RepID=A0ABS0Y4E8_9HYPH|nr:hypothetical protein [Microvirga splendida]MBJ6127183.1 hypothetical protein [Microvirga splendida]